MDLTESQDVDFDVDPDGTTDAEADLVDIDGNIPRQERQALAGLAR